MRHFFSFRTHIRIAVREYVNRAVRGIRPAEFKQEPAYTATLLGRLIGIAYSGQDGTIEFRATNVDSIAPGAAESWSGADLAITADIGRGDLRVLKAETDSLGLPYRQRIKAQFEPACESHKLAPY